MSQKMIFCKACGKEIAANAKACPECGAKNKKPIYKKWWAWAIVIVILIAIVAGGGEGETPTSAETAQTEQTVSVATEQKSAAAYEITDARAKTWVNSIGTTWVQTIVEITNTGEKNLFLSSGAYDLENADGSLAASQTMVSAYPEVLAPGEKGYMYEETTLDASVSGELTVLPREDVDEARVEMIRLPVTETELKDGQYMGLTMLGRVENNTAEDQEFVYIVAFLYDAEEKCIGQMFTILTDTLKAGSKIGFEMSSLSLPDDIAASDVASYVTYAYPTQFQF